MFVYSVKKRQVKMALLVFFVALLAVALIIVSHHTAEAGKTAALNIRAASEDRIAYLSQFGWSVKEDPVEVCEVIIPAEFDDVYEKYNELQKEQGFDLSLYASKRVKRWTYEITNYTGYENTGFIHANILVYDGKVIGGDVCSTELNGFMHGFAKPDNTGE